MTHPPPAQPSHFSRRTSGILLHPTSLAGGHGVGDLGSAAHAFADFLAQAGQGIWQMLPVCPTGSVFSPYDSPSSLALNPLLVDLNALSDEGWLEGGLAFQVPPPRDERRAELGPALLLKSKVLKRAYEGFLRHATVAQQNEYRAFCSQNAEWLEDHALFFALRELHDGKPWVKWPEPFRDRQPFALEQARIQLRGQIDYHRFVQFVLGRQWDELKAACRARRIDLMGDMPIYVAHDSVDVWSNRDIFDLDSEGARQTVAGVPPDYFSADGQLWGNPIYRWSRLMETGFAWWVKRFRITLARFDSVRLDHFIGLRQYWEVPSQAQTAKEGHFVRAPGEQFLASLRSVFGGLPFLAEDLGTLTSDVHALREAFGLPGMRVLQFAFDDPNGSDYLPHRYVPNTAVYTGTHDNDTTVGWFHSNAPCDPRAAEHHRLVRSRVKQYLGTDGHEIHWDLIRLASSSVAKMALFPIQDVLGLDSSARMNTPGIAQGNWAFRLLSGELEDGPAKRLLDLTRLYERVI